MPDVIAEDVYELDEQVGFLLRLAGQRHANIFQELVPHDLTPTQFSALIRLAQMGDCSQNELGRRTAMDVATIKGVVDRLKAKGMIVATPDRNDRRRSVLSIAPEYRGSVDELREAGRVISKRTLDPLTDAESGTLIGLLRKIGGQ